MDEKRETGMARTSDPEIAERIKRRMMQYVRQKNEEKENERRENNNPMEHLEQQFEQKRRRMSEEELIQLGTDESQQFYNWLCLYRQKKSRKEYEIVRQYMDEEELNWLGKDENGRFNRWNEILLNDWVKLESDIEREEKTLQILQKTNNDLDRPSCLRTNSFLE
ncbi:MAG: hypothetical protein LBB09_00605 [Rickettsiales bacterium]|nr:hypothetical protein [Rickettsiales bacterium]